MMSTFGDNTIKQDVLDALEGCQYGHKYDDKLGEYVEIKRTPQQVLIATLEVVAYLAQDPKENTDDDRTDG